MTIRRGRPSDNLRQRVYNARNLAAHKDLVMSPDDDDLFDDEHDDDLDPDEADDLDDEDFDLFDDDDLVGRLPSDEPYRADDEPIFADPDEGLTPDQARSRRALLGVPDFDDDEDEAPFSPTRAMQDALIEQVNDLLEDEWEWNAAAEKAYEALAIDPTYGRAANALLRCYLTHNALRDMQHALRKLFDPEDEEKFNQRQRIAAYSYRVLSRADFWLEWYAELPPELSDVKETIEAGQHALRYAYFGGEERNLKEARAQFKVALDRTTDRSGLLWYLARVYADKGYFADSAALLSSLIAAAPNHPHALRLYAEMLWWRDHSWQVPWIH